MLWGVFPNIRLNSNPERSTNTLPAVITCSAQPSKKSPAIIQRLPAREHLPAAGNERYANEQRARVGSEPRADLRTGQWPDQSRSIRGCQLEVWWGRVNRNNARPVEMGARRRFRQCPLERFPRSDVHASRHEERVLCVVRTALPW